jgi:hypothetical protein
MKHRFLVLALLLCSAELFSRGGLGLQTGIWKPSSLDSDPTKPFANVKGSGLSWGVVFVTPEWQGFALQITSWNWQQSILDGKNTTSIVHFSCDIKNMLVSQTHVQPYVTYGAALILGKENSTPLRKHGVSINFGAGVDFNLLKHWGVAIEYQYLYAILNRTLGLTDNYSGPKLTIKMLYLFQAFSKH